MRDRFLWIIKQLPKMRSIVQEVFGDYYYKEIEPEKVLKTIFNEIPEKEALKNDKEIDSVMGKIMNTPIPLNEPQYQIFY